MYSPLHRSLAKEIALVHGLLKNGVLVAWTAALAFHSAAYDVPLEMLAIVLPRPFQTSRVLALAVEEPVNGELENGQYVLASVEMAYARE
jgi:hypothetical protein